MCKHSLYYPTNEKLLAEIKELQKIIAKIIIQAKIKLPVNYQLS